MPLSILIRKDFSPNYYRDLILELLRNETIYSCHIASGFFSDFMRYLPDNYEDISISENMYDKKIFLYGDNENNKKKDKDKNCEELKKLTKKMKDKGLNVSSYKLANLKNELFNMYWHAKIVLFTDISGPVFSIIGSSNFTSPSMYGDSQYASKNYPPKFIQAEADVIYWLKERSEINDSVFNVFNKLEGECHKPKIYFNSIDADNEFEKLLNDVFDSLLRFEWVALNDENK